MTGPNPKDVFVLRIPSTALFIFGSILLISCAEINPNRFDAVNPRLLDKGNERLTETVSQIGTKDEATVPDFRGRPQRTLILNFQNPLDDYEANTRARYSASQAIGKGLDYLGQDLGLDDSVYGRFFVAYLALTFSEMFEYYSHEMAHGYAVRRNGGERGFNLDLSNWVLTLAPQWIPIRFPEFEKEPVFTGFVSRWSDEDVFKWHVDGLNQNESNAYEGWRQSILRGRFDFVEGIPYLSAKLMDLRYIASSGLRDYRTSWRGSSNLFISSTLRDVGATSDVNFYQAALYNAGFDFTKQDYLLQALIADLFSWHTWECALTLYEYLRKGYSQRKPYQFRIGDRTTLTPPLITHYLTSKGSFFDISSFLILKSNVPLEISLGTDVDFIGDGDVDRFRPGIRAYFSLAKGRLILSPSVFIDLSDSLQNEGYLLGVGANVKVNERLSIRGHIDYSKDDLIKNTVQGKQNGWDLVIGMAFKL